MSVRNAVHPRTLGAELVAVLGKESVGGCCMPEVDDVDDDSGWVAAHRLSLSWDSRKRAPNRPAPRHLAVFAPEPLTAVEIAQTRSQHPPRPLLPRLIAAVDQTDWAKLVGVGGRFRDKACHLVDDMASLKSS